jgi:ABC-type nickel/cobalt efflux system permease component RcnA
MTAESSSYNLAFAITAMVICFAYFVVWRNVPSYKRLRNKHRKRRDAPIDFNRIANEKSTRHHPHRTNHSLDEFKWSVQIVVLIGIAAIGLTVSMVVISPHSRWLGWLGIIDLALLVCSIPIINRIKS